jgi:hypothetical protein
MNDAAITSPDDYTQQASAAVLVAARAEPDFADWLAVVLAQVASELGSSDAITAGRPGSWEADLAQQLIKGTVGYDGEFLTDIGGSLR